MNKLLLLSILFIIPPCFAHGGPTDELGCHSDPGEGTYHCTTGPLAGLEFASKEEAREALERRLNKNKDAGKDSKQKKKGRETTSDESMAAEDDFKVSTRSAGKGGGEAGGEEFNELLNVLTWRFKKGMENLDVDRIAGVIRDAHITAVQDAEFNERGETPVNVVANILEKRLNEKICRAWVKSSKGERGRFAFIWRENQIGFVEKDGTMHDTCRSRPFVLRSDVRDYAFATFYLKSNHKLFVLTSLGVESAPRDREVSRYFRGYSDTGWAVIFAGDLKTSTRSAGFNEVKKWSFKSALPTVPPKGKKAVRRLENIWYKNISLIAASPVNLYEQYPELNHADLETSLGQSFPVRAEFSFSDKEAEEIQTQMISKKKGKGPASTEPPVVLKGPAYPAPINPNELSGFKEDLESEALSSEPASSGRGKKSKKKKKK